MVIERAYPLWQHAQREVKRLAGSADPQLLRESLSRLLDALAP